MTRHLASTFLAAAVFLSAPPAQEKPPPKSYLLNVGQGQVPPDTGMDDKTRMEIVDNVPELGGKALKVPFAPGDSFGFLTIAGEGVGPGMWMYHCHVQSHSGIMMGFFQVLPR